MKKDLIAESQQELAYKKHLEERYFCSGRITSVMLKELLNEMRDFITSRDNQISFKLKELFINTAKGYDLLERQLEIKYLKETFGNPKVTVDELWENMEASFNSDALTPYDIFQESLYKVLSAHFVGSPHFILKKFNKISFDTSNDMIVDFFMTNKEFSQNICKADIRNKVTQWVKNNFNIINELFSENSHCIKINPYTSQHAILRAVFSDLLYVAIYLSAKEEIKLFVDFDKSNLSIRTICESSAENLQHNLKYFYSSNDNSLAACLINSIFGASFKSVTKEDYCIINDINIPIPFIRKFTNNPRIKINSL